MRHLATKRPLLAAAIAALAVAPASVALVAAAATGPAGAGGAPLVRAALAPGRIDYIMVIELENEGFRTTFGPSSPATYLNKVLRPKGELLADYYAIGHDSLDNYIAQVSGQSPTTSTQGDCISPGFVNVTPGTPATGGQVKGEGCVYPPAVATIATQLDAKYPPNPKTHVASWRAYEEDMGNTADRDGGAPDPTGGTDCGHPSIGGTTAVVATASDQYVTRHDPFVWFHSIIDDQALCNANVVPLGTLDPAGVPSPSGHLVRDLATAAATPRFAFVTPNVCDDGHDTPCTGVNSTGTHAGGLVGADDFLRHWMPTVLTSPAYRSGTMLVVITFDESDVDPTAFPTYADACCHERPGPNTPAPGDPSDTDAQAPGGGRVGALLLNSRYLKPGSVDTTPYNHYSALRSYEDLLGLTAGGADGHGHLGYAAATGLVPFGRDVFNRG